MKIWCGIMSHYRIVYIGPHVHIQIWYIINICPKLPHTYKFKIIWNQSLYLLPSSLQSPRPRSDPLVRGSLRAVSGHLRRWMSHLRRWCSRTRLRWQSASPASGGSPEAAALEDPPAGSTPPWDGARGCQVGYTAHHQPRHRVQQRQRRPLCRRREAVGSS